MIVTKGEVSYKQKKSYILYADWNTVIHFTTSRWVETSDVIELLMHLYRMYSSEFSLWCTKCQGTWDYNLLFVTYKTK